MASTLLKSILVLSAIATLFVVGMSLYLVIRKIIEMRNERYEKMLFQKYSLFFARFLSEDIPFVVTQRRALDRFQYYEKTLHILKEHLRKIHSSRRGMHHRVLRSVLIEYSQTLKGETRERIVYAIYSLGLVHQLSKLMESPQWWIRATAARDLGLLGAKRAIVPLTAALEDSHPDVRLQAINSLLMIVGISALRNIFRLLPTLSQWQAVELSVPLKKYREEALPYLLEAMTSPNPSVVLFSLAIIGELGFIDAADQLVEFCNSNSEPIFYGAALETLGKLGNTRTLSLLLHGTQHPDKWVRRKALEALGVFGAKESKAILAIWLRRGDVDEKRIAARSLLRLQKEGIETLQTIAQESDSVTQQIIAEALDGIGMEE